MNKLLNLLGFLVVLVFCVFTGSNAEGLGSCSSWHVARSGYTCWDMASTCGVSLQQFMGTNSLSSYDCDYIQIGRKYCCN
ncbi:peptidoglycan-binding lysin domain [Dictyostelium discoideum AX4]|uniref:Peptidoglycan-binding lysin domain n=1 Tax=Dictyostelium discoideum TaxID=44689 RepID=Q54BN7_DICDI|nr:peptidoglycan-binding lysin domain [Dictyostelium discoideum AX4]EAL60660.1 peptidoglycan-binding lysin domain [Dictyostelium discoideum AX4]|eukprot:XP_628992.1 peptidoglycan-binding lysin domain [Dictyostelium discoideum AX4]